MARTQDRARTSDRPSRPRRRAQPGRRDDFELLASGRHYALGRRDGAYGIWKHGRRGESFEHPWEENAWQEFHWLERQARTVQRRRRRRLLVGAAMALALATPVTIAMLDDADAPRAPAAAAASNDAYLNAAGGYGFRLLDGWSTERSGSTTVLSGAGGVTISIDVALEGDLGAASHQAVQDLVAGWSRTRTEPPRSETVGDMPAIAIGGTATADRAPVRFLTIVVDSGARNHAIRVVVPEGAGPESFLPSVERLLASFRTTTLDDP